MRLVFIICFWEYISCILTFIYYPTHIFQRLQSVVYTNEQTPLQFTTFANRCLQSVNVCGNCQPIKSSVFSFSLFHSLVNKDGCTYIRTFILILVLFFVWMLTNCCGNFYWKRLALCLQIQFVLWGTINLITLSRLFELSFWKLSNML